MILRQVLQLHLSLDCVIDFDVVLVFVGILDQSLDGGINVVFNGFISSSFLCCKNSGSCCDNGTGQDILIIFWIRFENRASGERIGNVVYLARSP